ncbi:MAG TPA: hypothetical protein VLX09_24290 [Stellaceae bacterium]|nr:hypothetical protein [Stellaceae bacterium]
MRKILPVLAVVPLITGTAMAAQPLNDNQMNAVTAGVYVLCGCPNAVQLPPPPPGGSLTVPPPSPPPPPPSNAPASAQFSYILTINGIGLSTNGTGVPTNGISLQALLVRP